MGGPWAVGGVAVATGLWSGYSTIQAVRESWGEGAYLQAGSRALFGTLDVLMSVFAAHTAYSAKYGPKTGAVTRHENVGTPLPGRFTLGVIKAIQRPFGVTDIEYTDWHGKLRAGEGTHLPGPDEHAPGYAPNPTNDGTIIGVHPDSTFSVLMHEIMHALHKKTVGSEAWRKIPENGVDGKEQAAFTLLYRLFGRYMTPEEIHWHADYCGRRGGQPGLVDPALADGG